MSLNLDNQSRVFIHENGHVIHMCVRAKFLTRALTIGDIDRQKGEKGGKKKEQKKMNNHHVID